MTKVIVSGGAGFIGSHLVDKLVKSGHQVVVIDDFSTGKKENLQKNISKIILVKKSLSSVNSAINKIPNFLTDVSFFFHLAALPRIERSLDDPIGTHKVNVDGTIAVLDLARKLRVKRFIYSSSSSIYGNQKILPFKESFVPNPQNPYAFQKLMGEYYCKIFSDLYGLPVIVFRLFNVYGPRMSTQGAYKLVFTKWIEQIENNTPLTIFGSGKQTRDFTYISDIIEGLSKVMKMDNKKIYEVINLGYGRQISVEYLAKLFNHPVKYLPRRKYEEKFKQADIRKAKKILDWKPKVSIEEGVQRLINYLYH